MKITVTKPDGTIIAIDLSDESPVVEAPVVEPVYDDDDELGDAPSWNAPDAPGMEDDLEDFPSEDDDTDLEDWGAAGDTGADDLGGSDG